MNMAAYVNVILD